MISRTVAIIRENPWFFLGLIAFFVVLSIVETLGYLKSSSGVVTTVIWLCVTWLVQRALLFGLRMHQKHPDPNVDKTFPRFLGKGFLLGVIGIVLSIPFIIMSIGSFAGQAGTGQAGPSGKGYLILVGGVLLCMNVMLSLLGTWLPAGIYGQEKSFGAAFARGIRTFLPVFLRLIAVNLLGMAMLIAIFVAFSIKVSPAEMSGPSVPFILFAVLTTLIGIMTTTYTAVVLAETYLRYETVRGTVISA